MRRAAVVSVLGCAIAMACSPPAYRFRTETDATTTDAAADVDVEGGAPDAGPIDAAHEPPPPAPPIDPIVLGGGDFATACNAVQGAGDAGFRVYAYVYDDGTKKHCHLYFAGDPHQRTWPEAKDACTRVTSTTPARVGHLSTFPTNAEATAIQGDFKAGQVPWIGLELVNPAAPTDKASFQWVTKEPFGFDGWAPGTPSGQACVGWRGQTDWSDLPCDTEKGLLCELDE